MKNSSPITITIISAILAASIQAGFAQPSPRYIDKNCRLNQQLSEKEMARPAPVTNYGLNLSNLDRPKLTSLSILKQRGTLKESESRQHTFQGRAGQSITIDLKSRAFDHNSTLTYIYFHLPSTSLSTHPRSSAFIRNHLRLKNPNLKFSQQPKIPNKKKAKVVNQ